MIRWSKLRNRDGYTFVCSLFGGLIGCIMAMFYFGDTRLQLSGGIGSVLGVLLGGLLGVVIDKMAKRGAKETLNAFEKR
jgi:hypothetical protein